MELYSDHESRGLSLERLERAARRAWQRSLLLGVVLAAVSVWLLLFWSGGMAARGGLPLVWLRVFDPTFLVLLLCQGVAFGRSCRNARLLRRACQALRLGMDMPPSAGPSRGIVWENVISWRRFSCWHCCWRDSGWSAGASPWRTSGSPMWSCRSWRAPRWSCLTHPPDTIPGLTGSIPCWPRPGIPSPSRPAVRKNGASCYAPQLEAMYFRLLLPSMARSVAQAQMEQYRLVNLSWSYETLEHPGLDFVLLAREPEGLWQMAALGRGGQVAVYLYCGQEQLRDHLDLLSSWVR